MEIILHQEKILLPDNTTKLATKITAAYRDDKLVIFGVDTGAVVNKFYHDSGVEYWMTINKENINKLSLLLHVYTADLQDGILNAIKSKFSGINCYSELKAFFDLHAIKYEQEIWR